VLRQWHENLWTFDRDRRMAGVFNFGARSTLIRIDGDLLVHSPVELRDDLRTAIQPLGKVRWLFAPNKTHHLAIPSWPSAYPEAQRYGAPGMAKKRADLKFLAELTAAPPAWKGVRLQLIDGAHRFNEVALLHEQSRTLVLADMLFGFGPGHGLAMRTAARLFGMYGKWVAPKEGTLLKIHDRAKFRASIDAVLAWEFDRVVICHGRIVESGGREVLREAYSSARP